MTTRLNVLNGIVKKVWEKRTMNHIDKIDTIIDIISKDNSDWYMDFDGKEIRMEKKIGIAIKIYSLRKSDVQISKNMAWFIFAIFGGLMYFFK
jgi:hypothetical protein